MCVFVGGGGRVRAAGRHSKATAAAAPAAAAAAQHLQIVQDCTVLGREHLNYAEEGVDLNILSGRMVSALHKHGLETLRRPLAEVGLRLKK